jgi:dTDP-4-dehydrorhamnose 3,5-epimerase
MVNLNLKNTMKITKTNIEDLLVIDPTVYEDKRGYFFESYNARVFRENGIYQQFLQDNQSVSVKNTIRGLHFQTTAPQLKLVRAVVGSIWDVVVDLRKNSKTYGQWYGIELSEDNMKMLLVPKGFAHGFSVLSDVAVVDYKADELYMPSAKGGILYSDKTLKIDWKINIKEAIVSDFDGNLPMLEDIEKNLPF